MSSVAGNTSTTETLSVNEVVNLTIDAAGDYDWFRVSLTAGLSYGFLVQSNGGPGFGAPDPDLAFYNPVGTILVGGGSNFNPSDFLTFNTVTSGTYFISVGDTADTGGYQLTWISTDNVVNNTSTTLSLTSGVGVNRAIDVAGDQDWFRVQLDAGLTYGFQVVSRGGPGSGAPDADIYLHDQLGNAIVGESNFAPTTLITHSAATSGTYFVNVRDPSDSGQYTVTFLGTDNILNNIATTRVLGQTSITSSIDVFGDKDVFRVTLTEGLSYAFTVARAASGGAPDPDIYLWDANGNRIVGDINFNPTGTIGYTAQASGTYYIEVTDPSDFGRYVLTNVGRDLIRANIATTSTLLDGRSAAGRIEANGDADWFKFQAEQGVTYTFKLEGDGTSTDLSSARLIVRDANGNAVASGAGASFLVNYTPSTDSALYLDVQGGGFFDLGGYRVSVISTAPTVTGTAAADRLTGGSNNTVINGLGGNDLLDGGAGDDRLLGGTGLDTLIGGDGNDTLQGADSADSLSGGAGNDNLNGGTSNDQLRGGLGLDRFVFNTGDGSDRVLDFQNGQDRIVIESGATSIANLSISQVGDAVRIIFGNTTILLDNTGRTDITAADFLFI